MTIDSFASSKIVTNSMATLLGISSIRKTVFNKIVDRAERKLMAHKHPLAPQEALRDQIQMTRNIFQALDHWVSRPEVTKEQRKRMLSLVASVSKGTDNATKLKFADLHGTTPPGFLVISPTKRCNLRCTGCYASSTAEASATLDFATVNRIIHEQKKLWGSHFTVISGGEPLVYRSDGKTILDVAAQNPDTFFLMYTNGTLIDERTARRIAELGNLTPAISVEGYEAETTARRGNGVHESILKAFRNLHAAGAMYGISVTATKHNCETILSDDFLDFYFNKNGASYMWLFQYMPIGRGITLNLMVGPEQRLRMIRRTHEVIHDKELFVADFWNSATISNGCISAGRGGGYIYIDWNGDIMPCVFNPYTVQNVKTLYELGGNLTDALMTPLMTRIRDWQRNYTSDAGNGNYHNVLVPCPIRDHYPDMLEILTETGARPTDESAADALNDVDYFNGMREYGAQIGRCTLPVWQDEYCDTRRK